MIDLQLRQTLASNLKSIRVNNGVSVDACAAVLQMSKANYYKLESAEQSMKAEWLIPLCELLKVSIEDLYYGRLTRCANKVETQLKEYLRQGQESEVSMWVGLIGSCYRKKLSRKQYLALIELIDAF